MFLKKLELTHFRNYDRLELSFQENVSLFVGKNAQGKTNVLEAIHVLALAKSHRTNRDKEMIQWERDFSLLKGTVERRLGQNRLELQLTAKGKKAKLNGLEQRKLSRYIGSLNVVMFAPEDLNIVKGSPIQRRRFMDMEIGQVSPAYLYHLSDYHKLLAQRNQFLKKMQYNKGDLQLLDVWDQQLAELGIKILKKRFSFLEKLREWASTVHQNITDGKENLSVDYVNTSGVTPKMSEEEGSRVMLDQLQSIRGQELRRGATLIGPHRDDLQFFINDNNVQHYGSQGQQRTTALSVKLAELELIREEVGEYPLLLLDDVLSELDESRQFHLLDTIRDRVQTLVTTTGVEGLRHKTLEQAIVYQVNQGTILEQK